MSAKEMFEKLDGNYFENENRITIEFYNKNTDDYDYVEFLKDSKDFCINIDNFNFKKYKLDFNLLSQAINQQIKELGWLDEC